MNKELVLNLLAAEGAPTTYVWEVKELGKIDYHDREQLRQLGYVVTKKHPRWGCDCPLENIRDSCACVDRLQTYELEFKMKNVMI